MDNEYENITNKELLINDYQFITKPLSESSLIGGGSFSYVRLAKNIKTSEIYALKIIDITKPGLSKSFLKEEIAIHSLLIHDNIIQLFGVLYQEKKLYHILEYAPNGNLYNYLKNNKNLNPSQLFKFFYQASKAIYYLHENDIIHRDLKPENLLLDKDFNIKLCDFGWSTKGILKEHKEFCGTYEYIAPEIIVKDFYDYRVDIWSLGVLLYELFNNTTPFRDISKQDGKKEILKKICEADIPFKENIDPDLKNLIICILNKNPENRISLKNIWKSKWVLKMLNSQEKNDIFEKYSSYVLEEIAWDDSNPIIPLEFSEFKKTNFREHSHEKIFIRENVEKCRKISVEMENILESCKGIKNYVETRIHDEEEEICSSGIAIEGVPNKMALYT